MLKWTGLALLLVSGCAGMCSGIHDGDSIGGYGGIIEDQHLGGVSGSNGAAQSVCVTSPPPGSPLTHYAARCESYSDSAPVTTLTDWGSAADDATGTDVTFSSPCAAGYANEEPCYSFNGSSSSATNSTAPADGYYTVCFVAVSANTTTDTYTISRITGGTGTILISGAMGVPNDTWQFNGYEGANYQMVTANGKYGADVISSGCIRLVDASTDPYWCVETATASCPRVTAPTGKRGSVWTGGLLLGRSQTGPHSLVDILEVAVWDSDVNYNDWATYVDGIYDPLPQDTTP